MSSGPDLLAGAQARELLAHRSRESDAATPGVPLDWGRLGELAVWLAETSGQMPPRPTRALALTVAGTGDADHPSTAPAPDLSGGLADLRTLQVPHTLPGARAVGAGALDASDPTPGPGLPDPAAEADPRGGDRPDPDSGSGEPTCRVLIVAGAGTGSAAAAALVGVFSGREPIGLLARARAGGDAAWSQRVVAVRDALRRARPRRDDPDGLLEAVGDPVLAALTGVLVAAARQRRPVVLSGLDALAAALVADQLVPGARLGWQVAAGGTDPALRAAAERLGLRPLLELEGSFAGAGAGLLAVPLLLAAAALLA